MKILLYGNCCWYKGNLQEINQLHLGFQYVSFTKFSILSAAPKKRKIMMNYKSTQRTMKQGKLFINWEVLLNGSPAIFLMTFLFFLLGLFVWAQIQFDVISSAAYYFNL